MTYDPVEQALALVDVYKAVRNRDQFERILRNHPSFLFPESEKDLMPFVWEVIDAAYDAGASFNGGG